MNQLSVQSADWYDILFGGDENAEAAFRFIKECGFSVLDHNLDHTLTKAQIAAHEKVPFFDRTRQELLESHRFLKDVMEKTGVTFGQAHAPFPLYVEDDPDYNEYLIHVVEELLHLCAYLDCPALVVHPIKEADKQLEWDRNIALYTRLIPAAKETGVKICLENLWDTVGCRMVGRACSEAAEACRYIDTLNELAGQDCFGFCYDVGHANLTARNIREDLRLLGHRLTVLHIHDNDGVLDRHNLPYTYYGEEKQKTSTDWEGFLAGLKEIGYQGTLNFETFGALLCLPKPLIEPALRYLCAIGEYFRTQLN